MSKLIPFPALPPRAGHPTPLAQARAIIADAALCAARPSLCRLAWHVILTARDGTARQSPHHPRPDGGAA